MECFHLIDTAADQSRSFELTRVKFDGLHIRLRLWAQALNPNTRPDHVLRITDVQAQVERHLLCIKMLFEDVQLRTSKYGLKQSHSTDVVPGSSTSLRDKYVRFRQSLKKAEAEASTSSKAKWAIRDKKRFESLILDLKDIIENLEKITESATIVFWRKALAEQEMASFSDPERLQLIEDVTSIVAPELSDAASSRRLLLGYAETINSSVAETFYTAESYRADEDLLREYAHVSRPQTSRVALHLPPEPVTRVPTPSKEVSFGVHACKRVMGDLAQLVADPTLSRGNKWHAGLARSVDNVLSTGDIVLYFKGPQDTPYEEGTFYLRFYIPNEYPFRAPIAQLVTKIYHPNIDMRGRICVSSLGEDWCPRLTIPSLLPSIASLISDPNIEDPLVPEIAEQYRRDRREFNRAARAYTENYAMQSEAPEMSDLDAQGRPWWTDMKVQT
jgi:ubiquitin-conjugating enzyme E2 D